MDQAYPRAKSTQLQNTYKTTTNKRHMSGLMLSPAKQNKHLNTYMLQTTLKHMLFLSRQPKHLFEHIKTLFNIWSHASAATFGTTFPRHRHYELSRGCQEMKIAQPVCTTKPSCGCHAIRSAFYILFSHRCFVWFDSCGKSVTWIWARIFTDSSFQVPQDIISAAPPPEQDIHIFIHIFIHIYIYIMELIVTQGARWCDACFYVCTYAVHTTTIKPC